MNHAFVPISDDGMGTYFYLDTAAPATVIRAVGPGVDQFAASSLPELVQTLAQGNARG